MDVGGIGGLGAMGAMGAGMSVGAAPAVGTGGLNGPLGDVNAAAMSAISGTQMDQLLQLMDGFSSAEILIALMMAGASDRRKKHGCDDSAMGLLLGMALAAQLGQTAQQLPQSGGVPGPAAATGGLINFTV